jgi:hypothetical protein
LRHPSVTLRRRRDESQRLATAWCRGDLASWHPREGAETTNGVRSRPRGPPPAQRHVLAERAAVARLQPSPAAVILKSRRPKALRLGVRPPKRSDEEGRAFQHPTPQATESALGGVASVAGHGTSHRPRGVARTRGKLTKSRPGPLTSPPAKGRACSCWLPAPGSRGAGRLSSGHS